MSSSAPVPDWLRLQRKIFTRWVNQKVFLSRNIAVNDVVTDIGDGHLLVALMEVLSEKPFTQKLEKNCKLRVQKIDNLSRALKFTWDSGVQMKVKPSPEDLVDGDEKRILGLVWAIMLRFMKFGDDDEEQLNAKDALLMWVQNKTTGYRGVKVDNFQKSFHDGLALCAIIHKHRPRLVDYDSLEAGNGLANLRLAMDAAEKYFNLEQYLTPEDVLKLDENSMVVYVSEYYYGIAEQRKLDLAARRIGKVIKLTEENDAMKKEYGVLAQKLKDHLKKVEAVLGDRTIDNTMAGARRKIEEFYDYKENDKGVIIADQLNLEALFNNLAMRLSHNHRPEFVPPAGLALRDIVSAIHELEACEQERKVALIAELNRQIKLVELDEQHKTKHRKLKQWSGEKNTYLNTKEVSESVGAAQYQLKRIEAYGKEREAVYGSTFADLKQRGQYLQSEIYERTNEVLAREQELEGDFGELTRLAQAKQPVLEDDLAREQFKEKVRQMNQQHVDKYDNLKTWIAAKQAYLQRVESINSVSEAQVHLSLLDAYRNDNQTSRDTVVAQLGQLGANIKAQKYHTQYSSWVFETPGEIDQREQDIDQQFAHLADLAAQKQKTLEASLALELRKEELRLEFSYLAGEFVRWTKDTVDNVGEKHFGFTLEEVEAYQQTLDASEAAIQADAASKTAAYTAVDQTIVELKVNENPYTNLTLASLAGFKAELDQALGARRDAYQTELAKQRANDALCKKFAGVADPFSTWITETKDKITVSKAELEDQLAFVEARISQLASEGAPRDEINALQQQINDAGITNNRHTTLTAKDVEVQWQQYQTFLQRKKTMLEEEIERKRLRGLTPDQFREIEENFQQFDKRKAGALDARELKACLYSLGEERSRADIANVLQQYGGGSSVSYEQFREFMIHMLGDADTQEEIVEGFKLISRDHEIARVEKLELVMNEHDVNYVRQTAPAKGDGYDYHAWTQDVFSR